MSENTMTFEAAMQRLEQIVRAMERGDVPLEEALKLFQEGTELVRSCGKLLDEAQLQVKKVMTAPDGSWRKWTGVDGIRDFLREREARAKTPAGATTQSTAVNDPKHTAH